MLINEALIDMALDADTKEEVVRGLATLAYKDGKINDCEKYIEAVLNREAEYSTAVGFGIAIPHGKTEAVTEPFLGFGKVKEVDWNALDTKPVDLVFIIGVPKKDSGSLHLKLLAKLSRKLMNETFRDELRKAETKKDIIAILETVF